MGAVVFSGGGHIEQAWVLTVSKFNVCLMYVLSIMYDAWCMMYDVWNAPYVQGLFAYPKWLVVGVKPNLIKQCLRIVTPWYPSRESSKWVWIVILLELMIKLSTLNLSLDHYDHSLHFSFICTNLNVRERREHNVM